MNVAYGWYMATGEGMTTWIAIANTAEEAEKLWNDNVLPYYKPSMETMTWEQFKDTEWARWLPLPVMRAADKDNCMFEHFQRTYLNCS